MMKVRWAIFLLTAPLWGLALFPWLLGDTVYMVFHGGDEAPWADKYLDTVSRPWEWLIGD